MRNQPNPTENHEKLTKKEAHIILKHSILCSSFTLLVFIIGHTICKLKYTAFFVNSTLTTMYFTGVALSLKELTHPSGN